VNANSGDKHANIQTCDSTQAYSIMSRFLKKSRASVDDVDDAESVAESTFTSSSSSNWRQKLTSTARDLHDVEIVRNSLDYLQNPPPLPPTSHHESCSSHLEIIEIKERMEIAEASSMAQAEQLKRKESEITRLKRQIEELQKEQAQVIGDMRKKHQETLDDFGDQLEQMQKAKTKVDREKTKTQQEMDELTTELDIAVKGRNQYECDVKQLQSVISDLKLRLDQQQNDFNNERKNRNVQNEEVLTLNSKIASLENRCEELTFNKISLEKECNELKLFVDDSSKDRTNLTTYVNDLSRELIGLKDRLDDESETKIDLQQHHSNIITENQKLKSEIDKLKKDHEVEIDLQRKKLNQKILEAEEEAESFSTKVGAAERARQKTQDEIDALVVEMDKANALVVCYEKKILSKEKEIEAMRLREQKLQKDIEAVNKECKNHQSNTQAYKKQYEEVTEQLMNFKREVDRFQSQLKDSNYELADKERLYSQINMAYRNLEVELDQRSKVVDDLEMLLQQTEERSNQIIAELQAVKTDASKTVQEKEETIESLKRVHQKELETLHMQMADIETRYKADNVKIKKRAEIELAEAGQQINQIAAAKISVEKSLERTEVTIRELKLQLEDQGRQLINERDNVANHQKKITVLSHEVEELKVSVETHLKIRRSLETEVREAQSRISELQQQAHNFGGIKSNMAVELQGLNREIDDREVELRNVIQKLNISQDEIAQLKNDIDNEHMLFLQAEESRKELEEKMRSTTVKLQESEVQSSKQLKQVIKKLEVRVTELDMKLEDEKRRTAEANSHARKNEISSNDMKVQYEEDRRTIERLNEQLDAQNELLRKYKFAVEEKEAAVSEAMGRYRKMQRELEDAEERAERAEGTASTLRARSIRSMSKTPCLHDEELAERRASLLSAASQVDNSDTQSVSGMSGISSVSSNISSNISSLSRLGAAAPPLGAARQTSMSSTKTSSTIGNFSSSGYSSRATSVFDGGATPAGRSPAASRARSVTITRD